MKRFTIDAQCFDSLCRFFDYADVVLCSNFRSGRNLNAFHDVLMGGFGKFDYEEEIEIVWLDAPKSRRDLGDVYERLADAIRSKEHITFTEKDSVAG